MPLLDHFHPPLSKQRHWDSFHGAWAEAIARHLNEDLLPARYVAEARVKIGNRVEIDVATLEEGNGRVAASEDGGVAVWAPPKPSCRTILSVSANLTVNGYQSFNAASHDAQMLRPQGVSQRTKRRRECCFPDLQ